MDNWRYNAIRIAKYNPFSCNENEDNPLEGLQPFQIVDGEFTDTRYLQTEQKYIDVVKAILHWNGCKEVAVKKIEMYGGEDLKGNLLKKYMAVEEDVLVSVDDLPDLVKLILRGYIWCELYSTTNDSIVIRFGYDFYMYVNGIDKDAPIWQEVHKIGLFVD